MTWLLWRQHRVQLALAAACVAVFAIPAAITGSHLRNLVTSCRSSASCGGFDILHGYSVIRAIVNLTIAVPLLLGAFWGATIVGRELETGTVTLAWTQSTTRRRWLSAKLAALFLFTAACSGAVAALVSWWSDPANATMQSRFDNFQFDIQGVVPVAYSLFAAALGLAAGIFWRRTLPAMATTVGGYVGVRLLVESWARPHYMTPVTHVSSFKGPGSGPPSGSLGISTDLTLHGQVVAGAVPPPAGCLGALNRGAMDSCMARAGYAFRDVYQPAGRYWTFQWIEFGIFTGLAMLLVAVAVTVLRRGDA